MQNFIRNFLATLLALVIFVAVLLAVVVAKTSQKESIADRSYLVIDIYGHLPEYHAALDVMGQVTGGKPETVQRILDNLQKSRVDDRIAGVILKLSTNNDLGWAAMQEIRQAIRQVQEADKQVLGYCDSMDQRTYYLAAACDSLYAPPTAYITYHGFAAVSTHLRGTLEKLGVELELDQLREYKSAAELVTREDLSPHARENREWILAEMWGGYTEALRADRGLTETQVTDLMQRAVMTASEAVAGNLLDRLLYWDQFADQLQGGDDALHTVASSRYAEEDPADLDLTGEQTIAVIHVGGMLGGRQSRVDPLLGEMIGHETVRAQLQRARLDDEVAAVVLRVDSPGGESLTSDLIGRAVARTAAEKPVVVSMTNVAASGGYMISYRASRILADPLTITGSIGSISTHLNLAELFAKLGVTHDSVAKGPMALYDASHRGLSDAEWDRFTTNHRLDYENWLRDIAQHRNLDLADLEKLVHGRVWTGNQAVAHGLVDELGGLERAVAVAKELAGIPAEEMVTLEHYPEQKDLLALVLDGEEDPLVLARWQLYRSLASEWNETLHLLTQARLAWWDGFEIR